MKTKLDTVLEELQKSNTLEEMVHYPKELQEPDYQKVENFPDISVDNINRMKLIHKGSGFIHVISDAIGYVFDLKDFEDATESIKPVLHVHLRDSIFGLKQAHKLRIQYKYSGNNLAKTWYLNYIEKIGLIVSDTEHLEGGYLLWKSFIKKATTDSYFTVKLVDKNTEEVINDSVVTETPESELWSRYVTGDKDRSKEHLVLVFGENSDFSF